MSHPVRVRGLKLAGLSFGFVAVRVAPRAGAWVETVLNKVTKRDCHVAPRAGAWVETLNPTI